MKLRCRIATSLCADAILALFVFSRVVTSLKVTSLQEPLPGHNPHPETAILYDKNGLDWTGGMCYSRERASPINFDDHIKDPPQDVLEYHYEQLRNVKLNLQADSGLIFIDTSHIKVGEVIFNGDRYPLVRIDFHAQSEHLFKGRRYSMEIHLVHRKESNPLKNLVISVPVWSERMPEPIPVPLAEFLARPVGPWYPPVATEVDHNPTLQQFLTVRPPYQDGMVQPVVIPFNQPLDLTFLVQNPAIPDSGEYIQYTGGLTVPPCTDGTTWFVRRKPMIAADGQTRAFANSIYRLTNKHGNFRAVMPVNQRPLRVYRAQYVWQPKTGKKPLPLGPNARTDSEFEAEKLAEMAKRLSQDALDYMGDFKKRLRTSASGLVKNLAEGEAQMTTAPPSNATLNEWDQAVVKMQGNMQAIVGGVMHSIDKNMRRSTMEIHKKAAQEAQKAREMTSAWVVPSTGAKQGVP